MDRYNTWDTAEDGSQDSERERACLGSALDYCEESEELIRLSENIPTLIQDEATAESFFERLNYVLNRYQEQPGLLDPHIEKLLMPCLARLRNTPDLAPPAPYIIYSCKFIFFIAKVRGTKSILRWFPHEVSDLEPILSALEQQDPSDYNVWEVRFALLLWLAMVCIVPFDISRFDTSKQRVSTMDRILQIAKVYIDAVDKTRDATVLVVGRFLARPDVAKARLEDYLEWSFVTLEKAILNPSEGLGSISGILLALSTLYKFSKREEIVKYSPTVLQRIKALDLYSNKRTLIRKLNCKVLQRIGLSFLRARPAAWRYQRGNRSLLQALDPEKFRALKETQKSAGEASNKDLGVEGTGGEEDDVPEAVEEVLVLLLVGLSDRDTIVRWSAAKGLGRISSRLSQSNADDVVHSILDFFSVRQSDSGWHGGCLALAELARRGVLLPERLEDVVPLVLQGLVYDEKRGGSSVGAHVRDAACFVCWAFARAYDPTLLQLHVKELAQALVNVSLFDREVNCRKAASAAFQESVGRLGTFPHGIDLVTTMDYHAVSNRNTTYLELSLQVAKFEEYRHSIIQELYKRKLLHWDLSIRELSAQALEKLAPLDPAYFTAKVLPQLVPQTLALDLQERHGVLLGIGYIVHALSRIGREKSQSIEATLGKELIRDLQGIAGRLESAKLYRGLGGKVLRPAAMKFIEKMALSDLPVTEEVLEAWGVSLYENLQDPDRLTQERATRAFKEVCSHCYMSLPAHTQASTLASFLQTALEQLHSTVHFARMGFSLALGVLPPSFYQGKLGTIVHALIASALHDDANQAIYTEGRRDAITSIGNICQTVGISAGDSECAITPPLLAEVYSCLFGALDNYSIDNRGDIGAVVREASMQVLVSLTQLVVATQLDLFTPEWCEAVFCGFIKQANEKIDRTRFIACSSIITLLYGTTPQLPHVPHLSQLREIFPDDPSQLIAPSQCFQVTVQPIRLDTYRNSVLLGLVISIGGVAESVIRAASSALLDQIKELSQDQLLLDKFSKSLVQVYKDCIKRPRLLIPFMKLTDSLLTNACFEEYTGVPGSFSDQLFTLTHASTRKTKDVKRILASIDVFCGLLQFKGEVQTKVLSHLMELLCHSSFPRVRKVCAEQLYLTIVTYEELVSEDVVDEVGQVLSETPWILTVGEVKKPRDRLCQLLKLPIPQARVSVSGQEKEEPKRQEDFTFNDFVQRPF